MMKKNGFTLAEVLITLAIIGVVATLTLPALITNTGEQQAISAFKKGINTLTEAAQMNSSLAGFDYSGVILPNSGNNLTPGSQSLYGLLASRASIDTSRSGVKKQISYQGKAGTDSMEATNYTVFFRDGSSLSFPASATIASTTTGAGGVKPSVIQPDGLPYGIAAIFDTNGVKGPNVMSNCAGSLAGAANEIDNASKTPETACEGTNKSKRVIRDQFGIRLRGGYAVPNGVAARWAFNN